MNTAIEEHPAIPQEINLSLSSYLLRFRKLCERPDGTLKSEVLESKSHLSLEGFRSVLWFRWLNILSGSSLKDWSVDISKHRSRYNNLRAQYLMDRRLDGSIHPSVNNPLSQDVKSPWNQFFQDSELRCDIERDVLRSVQEIENQDHIKDLMTTMLFIYGKEHPDLRYRQGMHELLSSILLLRIDEVSCCQRIVQGSAESTTLALIQTLLKPETIENDVYILFERIMEYMWDWYFTSPPPIKMSNNSKNSGGSSNQLESDDSNQDTDKDTVNLDLISNAAKRLQNMWDNILQLHNKVLYDHLVSLNILPTTFGINWTKLLFTRQFPDYFHLWDAIIVSKFTLVDYIVVAMVLSVQSILAKGDSNSCNTVLVSKYPSNVCPRYITKLALHLQDTKAFHKPNGSPFIFDDVSGQPPPPPIDRNIQVIAGKPETPKDRKDLTDKHWNQLEQVQLALNETKDAVETSKCDHGLVQVSLLKLQSALDALAKTTEETVGPKRKNVKKHNRSASVAYEALAFE